MTQNHAGAFIEELSEPAEPAGKTLVGIWEAVDDVHGRSFVRVETGDRWYFWPTCKAFLLKFTSQRQAGYSFVSRMVISSTRYGTGKPVVALRAVIANPLTTEADIDEVLLDQLAIVSRLSSQSLTGRHKGATEHRLWRATIHVDASSGSISLRPIGSNYAVRSR